MIKRNKKGQFKKGVYVGFGFKKGQKVWNKGKKGIHLSPQSEFKKGMKPWNKGLKGVQVAWNKGQSGTHFSLATEFKKGELKGKKNYNWKGNQVGYFGLHTWLQRVLGKARLCNNRKKQFLPFGCTRISETYHWANRSRKYERNVNDWISLCISCHLKSDRRGIPL